MGDRTYWFENCRKCGGKDTIEVFDAPSCLQWLKQCNKCGWNDDRDYYEVGEQEIALLTKRGLMMLEKKDSKVRKFRQELIKLEQECEV